MQGISRLFSGLGDALHGLSNLLIEYVRIGRFGFDTGVVERALYQLEVTSFV
jgi:hypothetical protein